MVSLALINCKHLTPFLSQHLRAQYDKLFPALCNEHPDIFPQELYTWEQFLWACELWYSNSMKIMFADGKLRTCLIPIAGFLNHSVCHYVILSFIPTIYALMVEITSKFKIVTFTADKHRCLSISQTNHNHLLNMLF